MVKKSSRRRGSYKMSSRRRKTRKDKGKSRKKSSKRRKTVPKKKSSKRRKTGPKKKVVAPRKTLPKKRSTVPKNPTKSLQESMEWDLQLRKIPVFTGLEIDGHIFRKVFSSINVKTIIAEREFVDINYKGMKVRIHLEHIDPYNMIKPNKGENWFMINQELVDDEDIEDISKIDLVITKTHYATKLMQDFKKKKKHKYEIFYLSFTSITKKPSPHMNYDKWYHGAGASWMKSTGPIIQAWLRNPNYPHITILCRDNCEDDFKKEIKKAKTSKNITIHTNKIPFKDLINLQTNSGVHIVSSQTEGWGHYIHEARSLEACCIYSDYPPMNEFFKDGQSGIATKSKKTYLTSDLPKARGIEFTAKDIETAVNKTLKMSSEKRKNIGKAARRQFYKERVEFLKKSYE